MSKRTYTYDQSSPLRWVWSHVLRYKALGLLFVAGGILAQVLTALVPVIIGKVVASAGEAQEATLALGSLLASAALIILARFGADIAAAFSIEVIAQRVKRDARDELYQHLLQKPQAFHNRQRVGDLMARAINDARLVDYMLSPGIAFAFNACMALLTPLLFIGFFRVDLLLAPLVFLGLFWLTLRGYLRALLPLTVELRRSFSALNARITETIAGISVVKWSAQEQAEQQQFEREAQAYRGRFIKRGRQQARYLPTLCLGVTLAIGAIHGFYLLSNNSLTLGELVTYLGWLALLEAPTSISESSVLVIQEGYVGAARMLDLMHDTRDPAEHPAGRAQPMRGQVRFDHVSFGYGDQPVLQDISFQVEPGQNVAIVGATGSGKTTLTRLINRTYPVRSGQISIDGIDIQDWGLQALRGQIGMVEQDVFLFSKSIAANIAFGAAEPPPHAAIEAVARQVQAHDFITELHAGYATVLSEGGTTLSGGQRQRLVIARALLTDPHILILDDATSAVDSETEHAIQRAIETGMQGRTTFLITHRLAQIRRADLILVLDKGRLIDQGRHSELMQRCAMYRGIYGHTALELARGRP